MGNEMGNSNTSGLKEEDNTNVEDPKGLSKEAAGVNDDKEENHIMPAAQDKDFHEKANDLASDDPEKVDAAKQTPTRGEQEESEVSVLADSPKVTVGSDEAGGQSSENQQLSLSNESENEILIEPNTDEQREIADSSKVTVELDETGGESSENQQLYSSNDAENESLKEPNMDEENEIAHSVLADCLKVTVGLDEARWKSSENQRLSLSNDAENESQKEPNIDQENEITHSVLADSSKVTVGLDEAGCKSIENQQLSLSNDAENESLTEPNIEKIAPGSNENKLQKQASVKKEEERTENSAFDPISILSHDPEPQKPLHTDCNQHELATIHAELSLPSGSGSFGGNEEVLGSSLKCDSMENGHLPEAKESENLEASVDTEFNSVTENKTGNSLVEHKASQEEKKVCEDEFEPEDGDQIDNGMSDVTTELTVLSGLGEKSDEGFSTEVSLIGDDSSESESEPETISVADSPNREQEDPETEDKCMILTQETRLIGRELENGEYKPDYNPTEACGDLAKESDTEDSNAFQSESISLEQKEDVRPFNDSKSDKDCQSEVEKVVKNDELLVSQESGDNTVTIPELGIIPSDSNIADCAGKEEDSTEKRIVKESEENTEPSHAIKIKTEETKTGEENQLRVDQAEAVMAPQPFLASVQSDQEQESVLRSETVQNNNQSILVTTKELTTAATFDSTNLIAEIIVSMNELTVDKTKQDVKQGIERPEVKGEETKISSNGSAQQNSKNEISRESVSRLSTGSLERLSTDSDADNLNIHSQMRKSPSFNIDLRNEESESDQTPLLYQDKAPIQSLPSQDDVSLGDPLRLDGYVQIQTQYQAMPLPVEEKVVKLERSDSEKSKTPFLGFLKEEEEVHIVVTPQKHSSNGSANQNGTKDLWKSTSKEATSSTSPKAKEKRKTRSSLFGTCMCCATVIN